MLLRRFRASLEPLRDLPDYGENEDLNPYSRNASEEESYGCLMLKCPDEFNALIKQCADNIESTEFIDEDYTDGGVSDHAHVSLKYGICEGKEKVLKWCGDNMKKFSFKFTAADIFEHEDKWILVMRCEDDVLGKLNKAMCKVIPHVDGDFEEYNPHMTICYVKPDTDCSKAIEFANDNLSGREVEISEVEYSDEDDEISSLTLEDKKN